MTALKFPRIAHRVWLGPHPRNPEHDAYGDRFLELHPGWELITWTDDLVAEQLPMVTAATYAAAPTYVHRADIVAVEAVHRYGGMFFGFDMQPLRCAEEFIAGHEAWCTPDADGFPGQGWFGATRGHRAMAALLERLPVRIAEQGWGQPHIDTGPYLWGDVFGRFGDRAASFGLDIIGTWKSAYPIRYWEKAFLDDPQKVFQRTRQSYMFHKFAFSWANLDDVRVVNDG